jgi:hypothetical protein
VIATDGLYGFEFGSYVWRGSGLYTQLWGMVLLGPGIAQGLRVLRTGRGYALGAALVEVLLVSHLVTAYLALIWLGVLGAAARARCRAPAPDSSPGGAASPNFRHRGVFHPGLRL